MATPPNRADLANTPSNATAKAGLGAFWDYVTGLLGATGNAPEARAALGVSSTAEVQALIEAATKDYKLSVRYTTTGNITLSGLGTQAGGDWPGALTAGDRVLVKDNTTGSQNGWYIAASGAWTRATDGDATGELTSGMVIAVEEGMTLADSQWMLTTDGTITLGTTTLVFARMDAGSSAQIQPISASVASSALTISAGALSLDFRSTTLGSGAVVRVSGAPANLVISSGSTLGTTNGVQSDIVVLAINNAGTLELAAVNLAGGVDLSETGLISTTAEGGAGAADSINVVYTTTARTNVAYRVIGIIRSTQATAGTWATGPSLVQGLGGKFQLAQVYDSGWYSVATDTSYTKTHNLGSRAIFVTNLYSADAVNVHSVVTKTMHSSSHLYTSGAIVTDITPTQLTVRTGYNDITGLQGYPNTDTERWGGVDHYIAAPVTSGYYRTLAYRLG